MQLGAHVSASGGIHTAIDRIEAMGGESVQVFTQSPRTWRPTNHDPANFERFKERRAEAGIDGVACHALYLLNLASPNDDLYAKSVAALKNTVDVACAIEADALVDLVEQPVELCAVGDVVAGGEQVARVEADAQARMPVERVVQRRQLVQRASDRVAGAGGVLHAEPRGVGAALERLRERRHDPLETRLEARALV